LTSSEDAFVQARFADGETRLVGRYQFAPSHSVVRTESFDTSARGIATIMAARSRSTRSICPCRTSCSSPQNGRDCSVLWPIPRRTPGDVVSSIWGARPRSFLPSSDPDVITAAIQRPGTAGVPPAAFLKEARGLERASAGAAAAPLGSFCQLGSSPERGRPARSAVARGGRDARAPAEPMALFCQNAGPDVVALFWQDAGARSASRTAACSAATPATVARHAFRLRAAGQERAPRLGGTLVWQQRVAAAPRAGRLVQEQRRKLARVRVPIDDYSAWMRLGSNGVTGSHAPSCSRRRSRET